MKQNETSPLQIILLYLFWFATCGLSFLNYVTTLNAIQKLSAWMGATMWTFPAINRFAVIILAILLIIFIFWCENYYRKASRVSIRRLLRALALVTGVQVVLLGIVYVVMWI
ncbi:MAG: hypothetical protein AAF639_46525 [Chloroflexota bacterium]